MNERAQLECEAIELAMSHPEYFRGIVALDDDRPLSGQLQHWQLSDFQALDPAWSILAGRRGQGAAPGFRRAYIERPRGHSKTTDMGMQIAWVLLASQHPLTGVAAAADREQAGLLLAAIRRLAALNPGLCDRLVFVEGAVRNSETGSRLDLISSDVGSSYGILPDFVICDELSHWEKPELWYSLLSSAAKKPDCILAVLTNAGVGRGWQWEVREKARSSPEWYFCSLDGPQAPWITVRSLEEQRALLPPAVYERLWLNRWQHSDGEFVSLVEAEACIDPNLVPVHFGLPQFRYVGAIDYAEKHDCTAAVVMHRDGDRYIVDRMDVVRPTRDYPTPVAWVDEWIQRAQAAFPGIQIMLDGYQLAGTAQKYSRDEVDRFPFRAGQGNHDLAVSLRHLILQRKVVWYPGCGVYPENATSLWQDCSPTPSLPPDDLTSELSSLLLCQSHSGRVRIDHRSDGHDDRAFVLGVACMQLLKVPRHEPELFHISGPDDEGGFRWM